MNILRNVFFIIILTNTFLIFITNSQLNELAINNHQGKEVLQLFKREALIDIPGSLESFEDGEESLLENSQMKRSICNKQSSKIFADAKNEADKKSDEKCGNKTTDKSISGSVSGRIQTGVSVDGGVIAIEQNDTKLPKNCLSGLFGEIDVFFQNINSNLKILFSDISDIFNELEYNTPNILQGIAATVGGSLAIPSFFVNQNKSNWTKDFGNVSATISGMKNTLTEILKLENMPIVKSVGGFVNPGNKNEKISTCMQNIRTNVTVMSAQIRNRFGALIESDNIFSKFLKQITVALSPLSKYNFNILDKLTKKTENNSDGLLQKTPIEWLIKQNDTLRVMHEFLKKFTKGIGDFFLAITKKWSHEEKKKVQNTGLFGSLKNIFGWPFIHFTSHAHPEPNCIQKMISLPHKNGKHQHDDTVSLLKKIFKLPDHHHHHHHHHSMSIIKHILNSLYSIFNFNAHCECPTEVTSATNCQAQNFFNWVGGKSASSNSAAGHSNLHHNIFKHKPTGKKI